MATDATTTAGASQRGRHSTRRRASHQPSRAAQTVRVSTIGTRKRTTLHWSTPNHASHARPSTAAANGPEVGRAGSALVAALGSATVEGVDLVLEVTHHDVALELQGRGEVAGLLGEVRVEDRELADR